MGKLDNKVAVITGSGRGIGRATAVLFAKEGASVVINDIDSDAAEEAVKEIEAIAPGKVTSYVGDITKVENAEKLMEKAVEKFGKIDILVNNAGITRDAMVHKMTDTQWNLVMDVTLTATFNCIKAASKYMLKEENKKVPKETGSLGKVINVSSLSGVLGNVGQFNYSTAKAGLIGLTKSLAREWAPYRINVNGVAYGMVETRLTGEKEAGVIVMGEAVGIPKRMRDMAVAMHPWKRVATPEEAAKPILFLASADSDIVNGDIIFCAGGGNVT
jgi:3-oxoacyl-[acyl-carrier protein] reductase